ncbi:guanine nucleotide exchange factor for Rab-3A-like [Macrosteles quadrilineatus]|uniref:guanine nucleotide exchange factor for Rab-3A-like n=1 Tax=Macrosteles quadrilineatus TaxID=74068 RepID=UPI0023E34DF8|nr:guanine nucleotide exchange factor for Rab-3A-like [Macrosteles quadrilineatus]XP_054259975.1 guanine nucleotide exchange factor for Rab-3A-like [Macrosteles quadrilineatus]
MKAVDPSLEVSVIAGDILLPDSMTPKPDSDSKTQVILRGSPAKHPASSNYVNGDAKSAVNGLGKGDSKCNKTNGIQNGVVIQCSPRKERSDSYLNGVVNNGFDRGDEEKHSLESLVETEPENEAVVSGCRSRSPPEDIPRGVSAVYDGLTVDSGLESAASSWDRTVAEAKEHAVARLQEELRRAREELKLRDEEVERLSRIRQEVESELEELTASLFQEAHNMVRVANERQAAAEKALRESTMQVEVLTAEVTALKTLVLTSTPSKPNPHLHPQIDPKAKDESANSGNPLFRKHRRSPSHFNLKYGRENSPPDSPTKERPSSPTTEPAEVKDGLEVDPVLHREFLAWKESPTLDQESEFVSRVYREDIDSCLAFNNTQLGEDVRRAIQSGTIYIEAVNDKTRTHFPKKCALLETPRQCQYRMRLGETDTWHCISQICRNRIIAVCDFLNYLNYIQRGLVKSSVHDTYWEIIRLRKEMVLARLGLPLTV